MSSQAKIAGSVVAGFPSPAEQYLEPPLDLNAFLVKRPAATYFVRVEGESMSGAGIHDGDLLVVDRSITPVSGDIIIAAVDGEFTVKRLRIDPPSAANGGRRKVSLVAENPAYPPIVMSGMSCLRSFGKVTALIHRF